MPPVLDVALRELVRRGPQEVLPGELALRGQQGDDVLELVAEPVCAAGLVERGPRPEPAGQRLVEEPPVEHDVHRAVGRPDLDRALDIVPVPRPRRAGWPRGRPIRPRRMRSAGSVPGIRLAEQDQDLGLCAGGELDAGLQGGARIQTGAHRSLEPGSAVQAGGSIRAAVAPEELGPIGRPRRLSPAEVEEGDPAAELGVPWVANEERARLRLDRGHDPRAAVPARGPQRPLGVRGHRQAPGAPGSVLDGQHRDLQRLVERDELDQVEADAVVDVLEPAVARAVTGDVGRSLEPDRLGRRAPQLTALVIADVDRLAHRVADRDRSTTG